MKLLLAFVLGVVVVGLLTDRLDARTYAIITAGAVGVTGLFFTLERFWY
jgi:hypothetical protein